METTPKTLVEMPEFVRRSERFLIEEDRMNLLGFVGANPEAGTILAGTGGVRKLRWGVVGKGKSGGVRMIYYFYNDSMPIIAITLFAKSEQSDLTNAERNEMKKIVPLLVKMYSSNVGPRKE